MAEWSFNPQSEDLVIIYFKQVPLNKVAQAGVGPGGFFAIKEDFKMLDASALFTQSYEEVVKKFDLLSQMNDRTVYNQQIYDLMLDCLILCERLLTKTNQTDTGTLEKRIYICSLMDGLIEGETKMMKDGPAIYNRPEHCLMLGQMRIELQQKLAMVDKQAA